MSARATRTSTPTCAAPANPRARFGLLDRTEQQDLYELVEWAADRPWSSGKVGGIGQSYYAWSQWFMGIVNPPHLDMHRAL